MDNQKFCFICCTNNKLFENECRYYIDRLDVPEGYQVETCFIYDAKSMCEGYNHGMMQSNAKYKIYLHQDTFIIEKNFLKKILEMFCEPEIGMIGIVGSRYLPKNLTMWEGRRVGRSKAHIIYRTDNWHGDDIMTPDEKYTSVQCIDGFIMVTQYDIPWREDLFNSWHFYDISQSFEFRRRGYKVVVPYMEEGWCYHYSELIKLTCYELEKDKFRKEYEEELKKDRNVIVVFDGCETDVAWNSEIYELTRCWKQSGYDVIFFDVDALEEMDDRHIIDTFENLYGNNNVMFSIGAHSAYQRLELLSHYKGELFLDYCRISPFADFEFLKTFPDNMIYLSSDRNHLKCIEKYFPHVKDKAYIPEALSVFGNIESGLDDKVWDVLLFADYIDSEIWFQNFIGQFSEGLKPFVMQVCNRMLEDKMASLETELWNTLRENQVDVSGREFIDLYVAFSGLNGYIKQRYIEEVVHAIISNKINLFVVGEGWDNYKTDFARYLFIAPNEKDRIIPAGKAKIVLDSIILEQADYLFHLKETYEGGAVSVTEWTPEMDGYFAGNKNIIFFDANHVEELPLLIKIALRSAEQLVEMNKLGIEQIKNGFSVKKQAEKILEIVSDNTSLLKSTSDGHIEYWPLNFKTGKLARRVIKKYINSDDKYINEHISMIITRSVVSSYNAAFTYPYFWTEKYKVLFDSDKEMYYAMYEGKPMYYPKSYDEYDAMTALIFCHMEQDKKSPHCYKRKGYEVKEGDVVIEAGVAEGNFSLSVIDKASKVYLIECEEEWIEALKVTFEPYKDKVEFVSKYLSDSDEDGNITIDTLLDGNEFNFIKMDIEGAELKALKGAKKSFARSKDVRCSICTYHKHGDEQNIRNFLEENGMSCETSDGYMFFIAYDTDEDECEFRRGLVFGKKCE